VAPALLKFLSETVVVETLLSFNGLMRAYLGSNSFL